MESGRRQKWDNYNYNNNYNQDVRRRRSRHKKPPRGNWQPRMPSWEKAFLREVGSLDWETFLHQKNFVHLYDNVLKWDDSAGEEAFKNAKQRFWARAHSIECDIPEPNPDLYIDEIRWDAEPDPNPELLLDLESKPMTPYSEQAHEPVVIFGDSFVASQAFSPAGWGDNEEDFKLPVNSPPPPPPPPAYYPWEPQVGDVFHNGEVIGWPSYCNNAWQYGNGSVPTGYVPWGNSWGWSYPDNRYYYGVGHGSFEDPRAHGIQGMWDAVNHVDAIDAGRYVPNQGYQRLQGDELYRDHAWTNGQG